MSEADEDPYAPLFEQYVEELRWAFQEANEHHQHLIRSYMDRHDLDSEAATKRVVESHGYPAEHGHVIYVIRKYWLEVARLKDEALEKDPDGGWLEPLTFLVEDLEEAEEFELVDFLSDLSYWPIGLDKNMNWC